MEANPELSPTGWAVLRLLCRSTLLHSQSRLLAHAVTELERAGFVKDGIVTAEGLAAFRRNARLD